MLHGMLCYVIDLRYTHLKILPPKSEEFLVYKEA